MKSRQTKRGQSLRLTALMIEVEQPEGISARKLVLETARHNVLTAYSGKDGLALMRRFPNVDVVIVHTELDRMPFGEVVRGVRQVRKDVPVIVITPRDVEPEGADYVLPSHEPQKLLDLLATEFEAAQDES